MFSKLKLVVPCIILCLSELAKAGDIVFSENCADVAAIELTQSPSLASSDVMDLRTIQIKQQKQNEAYQQLMAQTKVTFPAGEIVDFRSHTTVLATEAISNDELEFIFDLQEQLFSQGLKEPVAKFLSTYHKEFEVIQKLDRFSGSFDEWIALKIYKSRWYKVINRTLRYRDAQSPVVKVIRHLNSALNRIEPYNGKVLRGASLAPEVIAQFEKGKLFSFQTYVSASLRKDNYFAIKGENRVAFILKSRTGRPIELATSSRADTKEYWEAEVLFKPQTIFKILEVRKEKDLTKVFADEMP